MPNEYAVLPLISLQENTSFNHLERSEQLDESSPAIKVMTDFRKIAPVTVDPEIRIDDALEKMKIYGVRLLLVIDDDKYIVGTISAKDIQGEKPIKLSQEARISRANIRVDMIMSPQSQLKALSMANVENAQVGDIIQTLKQFGKQHVLVLDNDPVTSRQVVCGIFSSSQVSKQLGKHYVTT